MSCKKFWFVVILVLSISVLSTGVFAQETQSETFEIWPGKIDSPDGPVNFYVPEGQNIVIRTSFKACARPLSNNWTKFDRVTLSMDGNSMVSSAKESKSHWSDPYAIPNDGVPCVNDSDRLWVVDWAYDLGALPAGIYPVHFTENVRGLFTDGADYDGDGIPDLFSWHINVDFNIVVVTNYGSISGQVIDKETGNPIEGIFVFACEVDEYCDSTYTDGNGLYKISLPPGTYRVGTHHETDYVNEFYNDKLYWDEADDVVVTTGEETPNINFALLPAGSISGTVIDEDTNLPIVGVDVVACYFDNFDICWWDDTAEDGSYQITGIPEGEFRVHVWPQQGYVEEFYNNVPSYDSAAAVLVMPSANTPNIDFTLEKGGSISGAVTAVDGGLIGDNIDVSACFEDDSYCGWATVQADGTYEITALPAGFYRVHAYQYPEEGYWIGEVYEETQNWDAYTPVEVTAGFEIPEINFTLELGGAIAGVVKDGDGNGIAGIWVEAYQESIDAWSWAQTDATGTYRILGLPEGDYRVYINPQASWVGQDYSGNPVMVVANEDTADIDFTLTLGGSISGVIEDEAGDRLADVSVEACPFDDEEGQCYYSGTDEDGSYTIFGVPVGTYRVYAGWNGNWLAEFYDDQYEWSLADPVVVYKGTDTPGVNFTLVLGGSISGVIENEAGDRLADVSVEACPFDDEEGQCYYSGTDEDGSYTMAGVPVGTYRVYAGWNGNWLAEFYDDQYDWNLAHPVEVIPDMDTSGINFTLELGGSISGNVSDVNGPAAYVWVDACAWDDSFCRGAQTDENGDYLIYGLPGGNYRVHVWGGQGSWFDEFYNDQRSYEEANLVPVMVGSDTAGIDFFMDPAGSISGVVTDADGNPLANIGVDMIDGGHGTCTDENGYYTIWSLPFGTYDIVAGRDFCGPHPYVEVVIFGVEISETTPDVGIDFSLELGGSISGNVNDTNGPAAYVWVDACTWDDSFCRGAQTDENGDYVFYSLPDGDYRVHVWGGQGSWFDEFYNDRRSYEEADPVSVTLGSDTGGIDFFMDPAGSISGVVTDGDGNPLANIGVDMIDGGYGTCTDESGYYTIWYIPFGTYDIVAGRDFCGPHPYIEQVITGVTIDANTPDVGGIDFELAMGGSISGMVTAVGGGLIEENIDVAACLIAEEGACWGTSVQEDGSYAISGLPAGQYEVNVYQYPEGYWLGDWNPGPLTLLQGETISGINFTLELGGAITGVVTDDAGSPIAGIWVEAYQESIDAWSWAQTDETGTYRILGLPGGDYRVYINPQGGWVGQDYPGNPVAVNPGSDTYDIDFTLVEGGTISGVVTDELGNHIPERIDVAACRVENTDICWWTTVQEDDTYTIFGLPSGEFIINVYEVEDPGGNWDGETYPTTITLGENEDVIGINFMLAATGE